MKQTGLKASIFAAVKRCGYELRRVGSFHSDSFYDQAALLRGREVKVVFDRGALDGGRRGTMHFCSRKQPSTVSSRFQKASPMCSVWRLRTRASNPSI